MLVRDKYSCFLNTLLRILQNSLSHHRPCRSAYGEIKYVLPVPKDCRSLAWSASLENAFLKIGLWATIIYLAPIPAIKIARYKSIPSFLNPHSCFPLFPNDGYHSCSHLFINTPQIPSHCPYSEIVYPSFAYHIYLFNEICDVYTPISFAQGFEFSFGSCKGIKKWKI